MTDEKNSENEENENNQEIENSEGNEKNSENEENKENLEIEENKEKVVHSLNLVPRSISKEMEDSYLDYAMSVIISRALPDVRDGLKPVHRRILYAMHSLGLRSTASFRKSAGVVGEVMGKYHPHGDAAIYDSMVRMAQDFSMRYQLVKGQGNFGSVDGDPAAAMRYTEAKLQKISDELLSDIDKDTVDWRDNYDGRHKEPTLLPSKMPQLLLNGTTGIAVGMATSIPPHNLGELIDGVFHLIENPEASIDDLMEHIKGPDFPTYGKIYDTEEIKVMYVTGRGGITMRARAEIEESKSGKFAIIITEIPYQVNKANLITKIADLVRNKKIVGITDIRDESNKDGIRVVIELKKDSFPKKILNQLFKMTPMQTRFNMNMIALVDGLVPKLLNLKQVLEYFIIHRQKVITRRTEYELRVAKERAHILEGLKVALDNIDAVITTIKKSETKEDAHKALMAKFKLSERQSTAILEMRLQTLAGLEQKKIDDEYKEKLALISKLEGILNDPNKILQIIKDELAEIKEKYNDERRTEIIPHGLGKFSTRDTIPNEPMIVMLSKGNYIKRVAPSNFRSQKRGGKGIMVSTKEEDEINMIRHAKNHDNALFFTNKGRVFQIPVFEIPQTSRTAKGQPIINLLQLTENEKVTAMLIAKENFSGQYLVMATHKGVIKKTATDAFKNVRRSGLIAIKIRENDSLEWVKQSSPGNEVVMVTRKGQCIRFNEKDVRSMGRSASGVRGIRLKADDEVVEMDIVKNLEAKLFVLMENGLGKSSKISNYRLTARGGRGVKTANLTSKTGLVVGAKVLESTYEGDMILISKRGQTIRMSLSAIPSRGRATQGVVLMRLKKGDLVNSLSIIRTDEIVKDIEKSNKDTEEQRDKEIKQIEKSVEKVNEKYEEQREKAKSTVSKDKNSVSKDKSTVSKDKNSDNSEKKKENPDQISLL